MYAVIDIGSNTIRLSIYEKTKESIKLLLNQKVMAGLAGEVSDNGALNQNGIDKAVDALRDFKSILNNMKIKEVFVFATASLRNITNTDEALNQIETQTGFNIDIITGKSEAEYAFLGVTHFISVPSGIVIDIGGGSTEMVFYKNGEIEKSLSLPIGSLNMYSRFVKGIFPKEKEIKEIEKHVEYFIKDIKVKNKYKVICGVGGSIRGAKKLNNEIKKLNHSNREIDMAHLKELNKNFIENKKQSTKNILKISPDRIHTLVPGITILNTIAKKYDCEKIITSDYGVREGYLYSKLFLENTHN